jgi:hypothetical protein
MSVPADSEWAMRLSGRSEHPDSACDGFENGERRTLQLAHALALPTGGRKQFSEFIDGPLTAVAYAKHGNIHNLRLLVGFAAVRTTDKIPMPFSPLRFLMPTKEFQCRL